ncbi:MAG: J domain-containing protein [Chloroflexi bacterium]|nr:J domain-containing protein [Chloroflexota bacterium]
MPVEYKDYYKTLGVKKDASADEIRKAYRKLARQFHPDVNKGTDATKRFREVNEANEVLSDPDKRKRYDTLGPDFERYANAGPGAHPGGFGRAGNGGFQYVYTGPAGSDPFGGDAGGFSDFFRTVFGDMAAGGVGGQTFTRRTRSRAQPGVDAAYEVEVSLQEAYRGSERTIQLQREDGTTRTLQVKIPAGVQDGQRIRLAGQGGAASGGGPAGDLYLKIRVKPHPFFTREGDDLRAELPVALHEALLGAEAGVPTLKGKVSLRIPPETQNGRTIRLAGQGMPRAKERGGGFGDLYVTVKVVLPQKLSERERELIQGLATSRANEDPRGHLL